MSKDRFEQALLWLLEHEGVIQFFPATKDDDDVASFDRKKGNIVQVRCRIIDQKTMEVQTAMSMFDVSSEMLEYSKYEDIRSLLSDNIEKMILRLKRQNKG
jgi:cobalamin-dependent methionine synthase I